MMNSELAERIHELIAERGLARGVMAYGSTLCLRGAGRVALYGSWNLAGWAAQDADNQLRQALRCDTFKGVHLLNDQAPDREWVLDYVMECAKYWRDLGG